MSILSWTRTCSIAKEKELPSLSTKKHLLLIMLVLCIRCIAACGQEHHASPSIAPTTPTVQPTHLPTHIPTVHPTPPLTHTPAPQSTPSYLHATHGPAVLGVSISNFFGTYGTSRIPGDHSYSWNLYGKDGNPYESIGATIHADGTVYRADVLNSSQTTQWSVAQSMDACSAFLPTGSSLKEHVSDHIALYSSPQGDIHMEMQHEEGDCFLQCAHTIGAAPNA